MLAFGWLSATLSAFVVSGELWSEVSFDFLRVVRPAHELHAECVAGGFGEFEAV